MIKSEIGAFKISSKFSIILEKLGVNLVTCEINKQIFEKENKKGALK